MSAGANPTAAIKDADCISADRIYSTCHHRYVSDAILANRHLNQSRIILIGSHTKKPIQVGPSGEKQMQPDGQCPFCSRKYSEPSWSCASLRESVGADWFMLSGQVTWVCLTTFS